MDLNISWRILLTSFVELLLLNSSASEDNTHNEEEHHALLPLYFVDEQTDIVTRLRSPISLQCTVVSSGNDQIKIVWLKNDTVIVNTTTRWIFPDGTLHLEAHEPLVEEGSYKCLAKHSMGSIASRRIHLEASTVPEFVQHPQDLVAFQGESVRLECIANGTPRADISWVKDGRPLDISRTRINVFSGVLQIINATQRDDGGTYECLATNTAGQQRSQAAKVIIHSSYANEHHSPKLLAGPQNQTTVVLERVVLECFLTGRPRPVVSWMKQGGEMLSSDRVRVTRYGNLEISSVQLSDAGMYICSWMSTDSSQARAYARARLSVLAPPQLVQSEAMEMYTVRHRRQLMRLRCEFDGVPLPSVVWMKNGQVLKSNGHIRLDEWELIIASSVISDSGFYQCRGENSVGAFQSTTWVEIKANENAPLPPVDLLVIPLNSTTVKISWKDHPMNQNRSIMAFSIHASPMRRGLAEQQYVQKMEDGTEYVWKGFRPFTNYTFYVIAYNGDGASDLSANVTAMTSEDVPVESPLMEVTPVGPTGLRLRWSELDPDLAHGVIIQYKILHRLHGNASYQQNLVNADIREFVMQGLAAGTEYDVVVLAGTIKGFPVMNSISWVTTTTVATIKTGVPTRSEMNISLVSSNSMVVSWMADNTLEIIKFRLTCRRINLKQHVIQPNDVNRVVSLDKDADKYIFTDLESYAVYQVTLASQNEFGWSESITKTFRTDAVTNGNAKNSKVDVSAIDLLNPPTEIFAESINSSAIVVRWERPANIDDVTCYTVRYRADLMETVSDISVVKFVTSPVEMVVISDLNANTLYDLSVRTHINNAIGPFSAAVKCRTKEGTPSEPLNIELTVYSDTTVQVTWNAPAQSNGVIIRYIIFYTTDYRNVLSEWFTKTSSGSSLSSLVTYLKLNTIYYFRLQAATFAGDGSLSEIVHIRTQDPSDLYYNDATELPAASVLSDQDLGIIIGTTIGVTCIILCVIFIVIRDRCSSHHAAPATRSHVANGVVKPCRCHLANGSEPGPWRMVGSDDDDFPSVNSVLVENENCDTKGGYTQCKRQCRIPVQAVARSEMCNGVLHCDRQPNQHSVKVSLSNCNEKAASFEVAVSDTGNKVGKLPSKRLDSGVPSEQIATCPLTDSDINVELVDTLNKGTCDGSKENKEADEEFPLSHFNVGDGENESEALMDKSHLTNHCCSMSVGIAGKCTSCLEGDGRGKTMMEEAV